MLFIYIRPMKKLIVLLFSIIISFNLHSQKIRMVETKNLIHISDSLGLNYTLDIVSPQSICYIDPVVAKYLASKIDINNCTGKKELFLYEFCISHKSAQQQQIQNAYIENQIKKIEGYRLGDTGVFSFMRESEMYFLTVNPDQSREKLLINYYNAWLKKSEPFKSDFFKIDSVRNKLYSLKDSLVKSYWNNVNSYACCDDNCYRILLALEKIGSKFATKQRMAARIESRSKYTTYKIEIRRTYPHVTEIAESVKLSREYNSIGEINYESEPELKKVLKFEISQCNWINFIYNKNKGYIHFGCSDIYGWSVGCEIELVNKNTLFFYGNKDWDGNRYLK